MKLDRALQRRILEILSEAFPGDTFEASKEIETLADESTVEANLIYLDAHGLIVSGMTRTLGGTWVINTGKLAITHQGLDFLQDDGGLSAILGVVNIRLHTDTIKELIEARILQSELPPAEKRRWLDQLKSLPADATKHLIHKLVEKGLENGPAALRAIQSILGDYFS